jgi:hypothetical protein
MEVKHQQQIGFRVVKPLLADDTLTIRAMPISAGLACDAGMFASLDIAAQRRRAALFDHQHDTTLIQPDANALKALAPAETTTKVTHYVPRSQYHLAYLTYCHFARHKPARHLSARAGLNGAP